MAWPRGQLSAEEILGMKPEELKAKLDSAVTKDDLTAATKKIEEQASTLSSIQEALQALAPKPKEPEPDPDAVADQNDPTTQMLSDPQGFVRRQTAGVATEAMQARADILEMRARQNYAGAFAKYGKELEEGAARFPLQQRAQPGFWDYHIRAFVGDRAIKGESIASPGYPSLMGSSSMGPVNEEQEEKNYGLAPGQVDFLKSHGNDDAALKKIGKVKKILDVGHIDLESWRAAQKERADA
jgi:hypothetical protein